MFKKVLAVIFALACVINVRIANAKPLFSDYADSFEIYLDGQKNGVKIVRTTNQLFPFISGVRGESFKTDADSFDLESFLTSFEANVVFIEEINEGTSYYAYSPKIEYRKQVLGQEINLHVFVGNQITVGAPIIYGSF